MLFKNYIRDIPEENLIPLLQSQCKFEEFYIKDKKLCRTGCFEGQVHDNLVPWLRCPSIQKQTIHPFSQLCLHIVNQIEKDFNERPNIVKIQYYENEHSNISSHTDKIIDLKPGSSIFNISLGHPRKFILTHKLTKEKEEYEMPHNSMIHLTYDKNREFLHEVPKEHHTCSGRYSLIFRTSHTFKNTETGLLTTSLESMKFYDPPTKEEETELIKLWSIENKEIVDISLYSHYLKTGFAFSHNLIDLDKNTNLNLLLNTDLENVLY